VEVKSPFTFYPREHRSHGEVTAYDWSCNQTHDGARFFGEVASLRFPSPRGAELRTFCIMLRNGIAQFVDSWVSESGYHLRIKKVRKGRASVDFLDPRGAPVQRPYMGGAPFISASMRRS